MSVTRLVPPLKGLWGTHPVAVSYRASVPAGQGYRRVSPSYRALAPHGAGLASGIEGHRSDAPQPTANYSLLTANSSFTSGNGTHTLYTYDPVSNITGIANGAGMLPNGLGGAYSSSYEYDNLYRLTGSSGNWHGQGNLNYQTMTQYHPNGRISRKNLAARTLLNGVSDTVNYSHYYHYENTSQPNTLTRYSSSVWNPGSWLGLSNEDDSHFGWNSAGNMTESCIGGTQNCRDFCWDEQNRLQGVKDKRWLSYYQYDAAGDRTYKLTGKGDLQNISGIQQYYYLLENATLYASPYLVATDKGYTKHYYAESERLASRIGGGRLSDLDHPTVDQDIIIEREELFSGHIEQVLKNCLNTKHFDLQTTLYKLYDWRDSIQTETDCYWYHPDHLGSSSWVTDTGGTAVQHLHYLPWGEEFVDQRQNSFDGARYTFSAKEKDVETGLSYFGSRYYSSDLSIWLSVDPMSDKYPSLSPYVYCANNPVKLVDPNGDTLKLPPGTSPEFQKQIKAAIDYLNTNKVGGIASYLHKSKITYYIKETSDNNSGFVTSERTIYWNPNVGVFTDNEFVLSPTTVLNHEFGHALVYDLAYHAGKMKEYYKDSKEGSDPHYGNKNDMYVITRIEQRTAKALGEIEKGQVTRTNHSGTFVKTKGVTSNEVVK